MQDLNSTCPISYMVENFEDRTTILLFLANVLLRMRRNGQNFTSGQMFNPGLFLFD